MPYKDGDVVRLVSGGPLMTVDVVRDDGIVNAMWFDVEGILHRDAFHPDMIEKWEKAAK